MSRNRNTLAGLLAAGIAIGSGAHASADERPADAQSDCGTYSGEGCAPLESRIDLEPPQFSDPTNITNPWFPIGGLDSVVLTGVVDGLPFRAETSLLPYPGVVVVDGASIEVALSQYTAYLDGRITEVALDRYAQADDGAVWYLGEDVYDYEDGTIVVSEGTWLAGRDGPPAMIMPGDPQVGQVFRPEQIPGIVFEEVTISEIGVTVDGPFGPVEGAIVATELHLDGTTSDKTFTPGYGEFYTDHDGDTEGLSLAVPTDRASDAEPPELAELITGTWGLVESARLDDWEAVDATLVRITEDWNAIAAGPTPVRIADVMTTSLATLTESVTAQDPEAIVNAAVEVAQSALDIQLRYRPAAAVGVERFHLHSQQLRIDAAAGDAGGVAAEVATLEWMTERLAGTLTADEMAAVDRGLAQVRESSTTGNLAAAADQAARLANDVRTFSADGVVAMGFAGAPPTSGPDETTVATSEPGPIETLLPIADDSARVDLEVPSFADSSTIDNPLFPVSGLAAVVALGNDEGNPIRVETSVLPEPTVIEVDGQPVEARGLMIVEYQSGRILDVAIKWYAQADEGSVWFVGEDSFTHDEGVAVADEEGTWRPGPDRPITMAMPSDPQPGDVFRPEYRSDSIEEYTVRAVGVTVDGPTGPVAGAIVIQENHTADGVYEDKWYAPGYGEFSTGVGDSYEAVAIALPADATEGPVPAELLMLADGAFVIVDSAAAEDWGIVAATHEEMQAAWAAYAASYSVPPLLGDQMDRALDTLVGDRLVPAAVGQNREGTANAALDVAQASFDLQLQYLTPAEVERDRLEVWARQLVVDANRVEVNPTLIAGDVATMEWLLARSGHLIDPAAVAEVDGVLAELAVAVVDADVDAMRELAPTLLAVVVGLG